MKEIINFSKIIWNDIINFQWTGWNISYKEDNFLYIKSSWHKIEDIHLKNALSKVDIKWFKLELSEIPQLSEEKLTEIIEKNNKSQLKSSIETWLHLLFDSKYVIHTHNVYINVLLCMEWSEKVILDLFWETINLVDYYSPWLWLFTELNSDKKYSNVVLLKNHWIILHWNESFDDLYNKLSSIECIIKDYLKLDKFEKLDNINKIKKHIFPDSIIIDDIDNYSVHKYIEKQIIKQWWKPSYLSKSDVDYIKNMNMEKYRKNLFDKKYKW